MNKCIVCGAETKNKLYCSQACRSKNATYYTKECDFVLVPILEKYGEINLEDYR